MSEKKLTASLAEFVDLTNIMTIQNKSCLISVQLSTLTLLKQSIEKIGISELSSGIWMEISNRNMTLEETIDHISKALEDEKKEVESEIKKITEKMNRNE